MPGHYGKKMKNGTKAMKAKGRKKKNNNMNMMGPRTANTTMGTSMPATTMDLPLRPMMTNAMAMRQVPMSIEAQRLMGRRV